jgi:hypothetical protein
VCNTAYTSLLIARIPYLCSLAGFCPSISVFLYADYFYDKVTGASSWQAPVMLLLRDFDKLEYHQQAPSGRMKWYLKKDCSRRRPAPVTDKMAAAIIIDMFLRCVVARKRVLARANEVYRRIFDDEYSVYFYWNTVTRRSTWTKPGLFLYAEPPMFVKSDGDIGNKGVYAHGDNKNGYNNNNNGSAQMTKKKQKRDPRLNRVKLSE